ncbi:MAG: diphthine--ammonia ligase [Theionarchaea archaeon]|nr:diphthine--ammonia ligase [Theionarchaea archaeon]
MNLGVLFSGGKDSTLALYKAQETDTVVCLISLLSSSEESYMFHTPNIDITRLQAEAMGLPLIQEPTEGVKEEELADLESAIEKAKHLYNIEGVVTGTVESVYQAERIQRICHKLQVWCFNPLWLRNQEALLHEIIEYEFHVIISGIFAYPLSEEWLGRSLDEEVINELTTLQKTYGISPAGEGGEIETTILDAPFFKKKIVVRDSEVVCDKYSGVYIIKSADLVEK